MYSVTQVATAADLALAITAIPDWTELVDVVEVDGGYWLITEPDDDLMGPACCCDCHILATETSDGGMGSMSMSNEPKDLLKSLLDAVDTFSKTIKR